MGNTKACMGKKEIDVCILIFFVFGVIWSGAHGLLLAVLRMPRVVPMIERGQVTCKACALTPYPQYSPT